MISTMNPFATIVAFYTLLLPIWQERPFTQKDINPGPTPYYASIEQIKKQIDGLALTDAETRSRIVIALELSGREEALQLLVQQLQVEKNPLVIASILQQLSESTPKESQELKALVQNYLQHPVSNVRYWAVRCYGALPESEFLELGRVAVKEKDIAIRRVALEILAEHTEEIGIQFYLQFLQDADRHIRASAVAGAIRKRQAEQHEEKLLEVCQDKAVLVRQALAKNLASAQSPILIQKLAPVLARDRHATVRGSLCQTIEERKELPLLNIILELSDDGDAEVRRLAAASLAKFPVRETVERLVAMLADPQHLVRVQVEESLVEIHDFFKVTEFVAARISDSEEPVRYHVYNTLRRIFAPQYDQIIARQLNEEAVPRNIAAAVEALGDFDAKFAAETIVQRHNHKDALVREKVAEALGEIKIESTYPVIQQLAFDPNDSVRQAAIVSIGLIGVSDQKWSDAGTFSETLLKIFADFKGCTSRNRAAACWSAARLVPINKKLVDRLFKHGTTAVVPTEMGPNTFEDDVVLTSVSWALAEMGKHDEYAKNIADTVIRKHTTELTEDEMMGSGAEVLVPTEALREYAGQAAAYQKNEEVEPGKRSPSIVSFPYRHYEATPDPWAEE